MNAVTPPEAPPPPTREQVIAQIKHRRRAGCVVCLMWSELAALLTEQELRECRD